MHCNFNGIYNEIGVGIFFPEQRRITITVPKEDNVNNTGVNNIIGSYERRNRNIVAG